VKTVDCLLSLINSSGNLKPEKALELVGSVFSGKDVLLNIIKGEDFFLLSLLLFSRLTEISVLNNAPCFVITYRGPTTEKGFDNSAAISRSTAKKQLETVKKLCEAVRHIPGTHCNSVLIVDNELVRVRTWVSC